MHPSWKERLKGSIHALAPVAAKVRADRETGWVYPPERYTFRAFDDPFDNVNVVILGQDPYHGDGQAHGLAFSVRLDVEPPPSLRNILRELRDDLDTKPVTHGCLDSWARQGVLLLNTVLTVRAGVSGSHRGIGWEDFTDDVIKTLSNRQGRIVFILWGKDAQSKIRFINDSRHTILESSHPSPLSAHRSFFGSRPFSKANRALVNEGIRPINWQLPADPFDPVERLPLPDYFGGDVTAT
jgi:uracil-DNA glycosylase